MIDFNNYKNSDGVYVIAEIGNNHQGNIENAKQLIKEAKLCGVNSVKLQKRNNKELFIKELYDQVYDNSNSYGKTYGEHREFLELDNDEFEELVEFSNENQIDIFATPFDFKSLEELENLDMQMYKIASADLKNTPLQVEIAKLGKPIFLSTGGGTLDDIKRAHDNITKYNAKLSILHCTASYPAAIEDLNLNVIKTLRKEFPNNVIGLSDHENGIDAGPIAYMLGARIFEKHFTLNRSWKGTDHSFSLEPSGLKRFVRNLNRVPEMLGSHEKKILESEINPLKKMAKSIVANEFIKKGSILNSDSITFKSPGGGIYPSEYKKIIGLKAKKDIQIDEKIEYDFLDEQ